MKDEGWSFPAHWPPVAGYCYVCGMEAAEAHETCHEWLIGSGWTPPKPNLGHYRMPEVLHLQLTGAITLDEYEKEWKKRKRSNPGFIWADL